MEGLKKREWLPYLQRQLLFLHYSVVLLFLRGSSEALPRGTTTGVGGHISERKQGRVPAHLLDSHARIDGHLTSYQQATLANLHQHGGRDAFPEVGLTT